jgi:cytochrome c oxidase subunit 4
MSEHEAPRYILIWVVLLAMTLAEVGFAFMPLPKVWLATGLIVMAFYKAYLVAMYYMHLKWEPKRLWVMAAVPLPLAVIMVLAIITEF